jgi:hypothetical protein
MGKKSKVKAQVSLANIHLDVDDVYVVTINDDGDNEDIPVGDLLKSHKLLEEVANIMQEQMDDEKRFKKLTKIAEQIQLK